jgi:hypothetical protein
MSEKEEKLPFEHIDHREKKQVYDCNGCVHLNVLNGKLTCDHFDLEIFNPKKDECQAWELRVNE